MIRKLKKKGEMKMGRILKLMKKIQPEIRDDVINLVEKIDKHRCEGLYNQYVVVSDLLLTIYSEEIGNEVAWITFKNDKLHETHSSDSKEYVLKLLKVRTEG